MSLRPLHPNGPRSDLADLVLGFCRTSGGLVEGPRYGTYEVVLPEAVASRLGCDTFLQVAFRTAEDLNGATLLGYGHPLVEAMAVQLSARPSATELYVQGLRLVKRGIWDSVVTALSVPNARLEPAPDAQEQAQLRRHLRFHFRAALVSDEKREHLVAVLLDAASGAPLEDYTAQEEASLHGEPVYRELPRSEPSIAPETLLDRAAQAVPSLLAGDIAALRARAARHLELDRARLESYYADLEADLGRRLERASASGEATADLEAQRAALAADRAAKLADAEAKYRLRLELRLVGLAVVWHPKLVTPVRVANRRGAVVREITWDPLRHRVDPFACDVCHRPSPSLLLCLGGHLAHEDCLAPACIDCQRVRCRLCAPALGACAVCQEPVCPESLQRCSACGQGTCAKHLGRCHASAEAAGALPRSADGPADATGASSRPAGGAAWVQSRFGTEGEARRADGARPGAEAGLPSSEPGQPQGVGATPAPPERSSGRRRPTTSGATRRKPSRDRRKGPPRVRRRSTTELRLLIDSDPSEPRIVALVVDRRMREVAQRVWFLTDEGIGVACWCARGADCQWDGVVLSPPSPSGIEPFLEEELALFEAEHGLPVGAHRSYATTRHGSFAKTTTLTLAAAWKDEALLKAARRAFEALPW